MHNEWLHYNKCKQRDFDHFVHRYTSLSTSLITIIPFLKLKCPNYPATWIFVKPVKKMNKQSGIMVPLLPRYPPTSYKYLISSLWDHITHLTWQVLGIRYHSSDQYRLHRSIFEILQNRWSGCFQLISLSSPHWNLLSFFSNWKKTKCW